MIDLDELIAALRERAVSDSPAHTLMDEAADALEAATRERDDAAVAALERVRNVLELLRNYAEETIVTTHGMLSASFVKTHVEIALSELDGAPEPEWEYGVQYIPPSVCAGEPVKCGSERAARLAVRGTSEPIRLLRRRPKVVHPAGPWIPVEGEKP